MTLKFSCLFFNLADTPSLSLSVFLSICLSVCLSLSFFLFLCPVPPSFTMTPSPVSIGIENTPHELTCLVDGDPTPQITWLLLGGVIAVGSTLSFANLQRTDAENYTCTATNIAGTISATISLEVFCEYSTFIWGCLCQCKGSNVGFVLGMMGQQDGLDTRLWANCTDYYLSIHVVHVVYFQ